MFWLALKHRHDEILGIFRDWDMAGKAVLVGNNTLVRGLHILRFIWWLPDQHGEENDSHRPNVYFERVPTGCLVTLDDFWGNIVGSSADCLTLFVWVLQLCCQSKVPYFNTEVAIQEQVSQLEITVDNAAIVKMQDGIEKLSHKQGSFWLCETLSALYHFIHTLVVTKF